MSYVGHDGTIYRVRDLNRALARPGIPFSRGPYNVCGTALMTDRGLLVARSTTAIYRINLDPTGATGRTISPIAGATVLEGCGVLLDVHRLVVADSKACRSSSSARTPPADPSPSSPRTLIP